jgi:outer membrane protein assembly factor BamB/tRNA A-37 threonylcarbamoyl transferase component Bud32
VGAERHPSDGNGGARTAVGESFLAPGTLLQNGRYEVDTLIGKGGMGAVYLVRDTHFLGPKPVLRALKEMMPRFSDLQANLAIFTREANMLVTLKHTGIPAVHDSFTEFNRAYLVLDYVPGYDLQQILNRTDGMLMPEEVGEWMLQLCDIVHYLHTRQPPVIFRDLKPSNVILTPEGLITLIDFGIAKIFAPEDDQTSIGTPGYAPREQYEGRAESRSDIYALGAMMHHLLTQSDPRRFAPFTFAERMPRSLNPAISPELEDVIMRCLNERPAERYQTVDELRAAVEHALFSEPAITTAPWDLSNSLNLTESAPGWRRAPAYVPAEGVQPRTIWCFRTDDEVRSTPVVNRDKLFVGSYDHRLYALDLRTGERIWHYTTEGGICGTPLLWQELVIFGSEDFSVYAVEQITAREVWSYRTGSQVRSSPRIFDDRLYIGSDDGHLYALDPRRGHLHWKYRAYRAVQSSVTAGDGLIFFGSADEYLYAVTTAGERKWAYRANGPILSSPAYDDGHIYFGSMDFSVYCVEAKLGWAAWTERTEKFVVSSPCVAGDRVFIGSTDGHLYCLHRRTGKRLWRHAVGQQVNGTPIHVDGAIYFGAIDGGVYCLDATTGKLRWRFQTEGKVPGSLCLHQGIVYVGSTDGWVYAIEPRE